MKKIIIKKSQNADTRTCDCSKVSKNELLESSKSHIEDVRQGLNLLALMIKKAGEKHDFTKIENIDEFYEDFKTNFEQTSWWEMHQKKERHHFNTDKYVQEDVNLIDVLEQIVDGVMAGMARSGKYRKEMPSAELLLKAYENTADLLLDNLQVQP